jgi:hypothetical protein
MTILNQLRMWFNGVWASPIALLASLLLHATKYGDRTLKLVWCKSGGAVVDFHQVSDHIYLLVCHVTSTSHPHQNSYAYIDILNYTGPAQLCSIYILSFQVLSQPSALLVNGSFSMCPTGTLTRGCAWANWTWETKTGQFLCSLHYSKLTSAQKGFQHVIFVMYAIFSVQSV